ncbi:MAG: hypothetical protein LBH42_09255 [Treponema sp.]|nr:hypothetical protein [Treponema sp.]
MSTEIPEPAIIPGPANSIGITGEIRSFTEIGTPSSLIKALDTISDRELGSTEFGRVMVYVNVTLLKNLYPAVSSPSPSLDPPVTHLYSRILRETERGVYTAPRQNSGDYLECVLPFLAYYGKAPSPDVFPATLPDLEKAVMLNGESVLAPFFLGVVFENTGRLDDAFSQYSMVWERYPECFPAALGISRVMDAQGRKQESVRFMSALLGRFPGNDQVRRQMAIAYYRSGDWVRAEAAVSEILQNNSRDGEFILMRAHILVEQGLMLQAQAPLDTYAGINPNNKLYLFLRARIQAEVFQNREAALNYLRSMLRSSPTGDDEAAVYAVRLMMESSRPADQTEGRELLSKLLSVPVPSLEVVSLALRDAIRREAWGEARSYLVRLLADRRSSQDLLAVYTMEKEQGNNAAALSYARELYERDRTNEEGSFAYISALIETGRRDEAARMIESRLGTMPGGVLKGRYYYLRSLTWNNEEMALNDLRSSLFEDPRNLFSLIASFEIYHRRGDERRAVYYLKQALALAPDNLRLRGYEAEYGTF